VKGGGGGIFVQRTWLTIAAAICAFNVSAQDSATTGAASLSDYIYTAPQGWAATPYPDGIVINSPVSNTGERCFIALWPMRASSGDLENDVGNVFREVFRDFVPRQGLTSASALRGVCVRLSSSELSLRQMPSPDSNKGERR
jgi:hypothetical protein